VKANAAGALGNMVRNATSLCDDLIATGAVQVRATARLACSGSSVTASMLCIHARAWLQAGRSQWAGALCLGCRQGAAPVSVGASMGVGDHKEMPCAPPVYTHCCCSQALVHVVTTSSSSAPGRPGGGDAQSPVKISPLPRQHLPARPLPEYLQTLDIVRIAQRLTRSPDATVAKYAD